MNDMKYFIGREGFVWFLGVVEDRNDPDQLGRVRVRCFGWHTDDKTLIPTDALPWAHPVHPTSVPASYTPKEGDWVVGFFADGESAQNPFILGTIPGKPTTKPDTTKGFSDASGKYPKYLNESTLSRLARGNTQGTVVETRKRNQTKGVGTASGGSWSEPAPAYGTQYPFNFAHETESGHALELDDTAGKERVHLAHKNGTYIEMDAQGNRAEKIVKDNYTVILGSDYLYVAGKCSITVAGDLDLKVGGTFNVQAGAIHMTAAKEFKALGASGMKLESSKSMDLKSGSSMTIGGSGALDLSGSKATLQGSKVDVVAAAVDLQAASSAAKPSGSGLKPISSKSSVSSGVTSSTIASAATQQGKLGATASVSSVYTTATGAINTGMAKLKSTSAIGELTSTLQGVESKLNNEAGAILNLPSDQVKTIQSGVTEMTTLATTKGIDMNIDPRLQVQMLPVTSTLGKRLYPSTESVKKGS